MLAPRRYFFLLPFFCSIAMPPLVATHFRLLSCMNTLASAASLTTLIQQTSHISQYAHRWLDIHGFRPPQPLQSLHIVGLVSSLLFFSLLVWTWLGWSMPKSGNKDGQFDWGHRKAAVLAGSSIGLHSLTWLIGLPSKCTWWLGYKTSAPLPVFLVAFATFFFNIYVHRENRRLDRRQVPLLPVSEREWTEVGYCGVVDGGATGATGECEDKCGLGRWNRSIECSYSRFLSRFQPMSMTGASWWWRMASFCC